jgi:hypothetical protein
MNSKKPTIAVPFFVGLVVGVLATVFLPGYVRPYLPQWVMGKTIVVKGTITAKQKKEKVLLLTVDTPEGVMLATFKKKVDEINLLINEKDTIDLTVPKYMPFIDDPKIVRVVKEQQAVPEPAPAARPREQGIKEGKPKPQDRPSAAASAPSTTPREQGIKEGKPKRQDRPSAAASAPSTTPR